MYDFFSLQKKVFFFFNQKYPRLSKLIFLEQL